MPDNTYCYKGTDVLINKLNIMDRSSLFEAEKRLTFIRLQELQKSPIRGNFDYAHLRAIHKYIFQDIYEWAGKERTVEIGKGNLFCITACIREYAQTVFDKYYAQCFSAKENFDDFIEVFAENYGDVNALHPFREGNGRTQREFARLVCLESGYDFDLSGTTHREMLEASKLSFDKGDNTHFIRIFSKAVMPHNADMEPETDRLSILTNDDLIIDWDDGYGYYEYTNSSEAKQYDEVYRVRINKMNSDKSKVGIS